MVNARDTSRPPRHNPRGPRNRPKFRPRAGRSQNTRRPGGVRVNQFLRGVARAAVESFELPDPVLEIASYQVAGQEGLIELRDLFAGRPYTGVDFRAGPGVD